MTKLSDLTSNARWDVRAIWKRSNIALTRPSPNGHGWSVQEAQPTDDLTDLLNKDWQVVKQGEDEAE